MQVLQELWDRGGSHTAGAATGPAAGSGGGGARALQHQQHQHRMERLRRLLWLAEEALSDVVSVGNARAPNAEAVVREAVVQEAVLEGAVVDQPVVEAVEAVEAAGGGEHGDDA
jgi:hypothetical protein